MIVKPQSSLNDKNKFIFSIIRLKRPDSSWNSQIKPDPNVLPQTHLVRGRTIHNYTVKNNHYIFRGNDYFYSNPVIYNDSANYEIDDYNAFILGLLDRDNIKITNDVIAHGNYFIKSKVLVKRNN